MVCFGFVGCPHRTAGSYLVLAFSMLCAIVCIRFVLYVVAEACCNDDEGVMTTEITERNIREDREVRERAASEAMRQLVLRLYPPWLTQPPPPDQTPNADLEANREWDSKLVIVAGGDRVSGIARPCPLNPPIEVPK